MTIKQKIWRIPLVTILIFSIGMAIIYIASSHTHDLLQRSGNLHHPYLHNIQVLLSNLKGIQENFQNAIVINDSSAITLAQQKAEKFRQIGQEIASLDGKKAIAQSLRSQFDEYFAPAESATFMMLGIKPGDPMPELERMTVVLNKLTEALQHEELAAAQAFEKSLDKSRSIVQGMLWVNLASVVFVVIGLVYSSHRLITSIMKNLEYLRTNTQRIAQGDLTARIPENGNDELTLVIQSFNRMGDELQVATGKHIQYEQKLEMLNQELEDRVIARTAELGVALDEANKANAAVAYIADHDTLTGLLNRRRFQEEFERWGKYAVRYERAGALMFIDLDKFKDINDTYGHLGGDEYLLAVASLLKKALRSTDYVGRWGGDEFAALLPEIDAIAAQEIAGKLIKVFSETPVTVGSNTLYASVSIGIAVLPDHTADINELMAFADAAMYKAKEAGRSCYRVYSATAHEVQRVDEHARWAGRIRRALDTDQFILFYQPVLNLKTGETTEYEALLRMEDTNGRFISPGLFLESAERFDLNIPIDRMVIRKGAHRIATLNEQSISLHLSLNLSHKTLDDAGLIHYISEAIDEYRIDPANLAFEISEAAMMQNMSRIRNLSAQITQLGCRLILDDIGIGFSSFHYLAPLCIRSIKIQGDLIRNLQHAENYDYVAMLCKTCRELNIEVVAKYVEDLSLLGGLRSIGVDYAQGFAVGKPLESLGEFGVAA